MKTALSLGIDYYYSEAGEMVLTEFFHLKKGFCCGNACRHCPYEYEAVPEPQRSRLMKQPKNHASPKK